MGATRCQEHSYPVRIVEPMRRPEGLASRMLPLQLNMAATRGSEAWCG